MKKIGDCTLRGLPADIRQIQTEENWEEAEACSPWLYTGREFYFAVSFPIAYRPDTFHSTM